MKKILSFIAAAVLTLSFTGCEDVPAPYGIPFQQMIDDGSADDILKALFSTSLDGFKVICTEGDYTWKVDYSCAQVTAYVDGNNNKADSWLISPEVDLTGEDAAHIVFDYILRYANASDLKKCYQLLISSEYSQGEHPLQYPWEDLDWNRVLGADWNTWYSSGKVNIPEEYLGKKVYVALRYISDTKAATWEVKNFKVRRGAGDYGQPVDPNMVVQLPYTETFSAGLGYFRNFTISGKDEWYIDYSTAKATGYDGTNRNEGVIYLISPIIQLNNEPVQLDYEYILQYFVKKEDQQVLINDHFDESNPTEGWTLLNNNHTYGRVDNTGKVVWSIFDPAFIQIPDKYLGKQVRIAFRYESHNGNCSTWEVRNFKIYNGNEGNIVDNIGDETAPNGDFECWIDGQPNNWNTGYNTAVLERVSDAHGGKYAIQIGGTPNGDTRMGYKAISLDPGTYVMRAYFKSASGTISPNQDQQFPQIQFTLLNGATSSPIAAIHRQSQVQTVMPTQTSEWVELSFAFTLTQAYEGGVSPAIIVKKTPGLSVIMDDFVLEDISTQNPVRIIY